MHTNIFLDGSDIRYAAGFVSRSDDRRFAVETVRSTAVINVAEKKTVVIVETKDEIVGTESGQRIS